MEDRSIVRYLGLSPFSRCGYCKTESQESQNQRESHGMWAYYLTVQDYQDMLDRGWRRFGQYCYKKTMETACCPHYTIRCHANDFRLKKSHKKVLRRMQNYLLFADKGRTGTVTSPDKINAVDSAKPPRKADAKKAESRSVDDQSSAQREPVVKVKHTTDKPFLKTKVVRRQKMLDKFMKSGLTNEEAELKLSQVNCARIKADNDREKSLSQRLQAECSIEAKHKLEFRIISTNSQCDAFRETLNESHAIYLKYQVHIHGDAPTKTDMKQFTRFLCTSPLILNLLHVGSPEFEESLDESFKVYERYQQVIGSDGSDLKSYTEFLVDSPLRFIAHDNPNHPGYGTFHQQYLLDGKIIAVGVIDILPFCVSSKCFYYDPDYAFLSLGVYSALREIILVQNLSKMAEQLKYYYMGFYIHSCPKMKCKAQYFPSDLLCPEAYTWQPVEDCVKKLENSRYARFEPDIDKIDADASFSEDSVQIFENGTVISFAAYLQSLTKKLRNKASRDRITEKKRDLLNQYGNAIGRKCVPRIVFMFSD